MESVVDQSYWDSGYKNIKFSIANDDVTKKISDSFDEILAENISLQKELSCFEIGFYPARYLSFWGKRYNMVVNGVDLTGELDGRIEKWLRENDIKVGVLEHGDFVKCISKLSSDGIAYDVVYSAGFIEHFDNYADVIRMHDKILRPGGIMFITVPNFRGIIQWLLHLMVDKKNLDRHVIRSMNPNEWESIVLPLGYKTIEKGYFGGFDFWVDNQKRNAIQKFLLKVIMRINSKLHNSNMRNSKAYSPYCILIAKKNENG